MVKLNRRKSGRNDKYRKRVSDEALAAALEATGGFQGMAARMLSLTPAAVCIRIQKSQKLQEHLDNIREDKLDIAETELMHLIREGNLGAICFYLKCKGKSRGFIEKTEVDQRVTVGSGVLIVPGVSNSVEEWEDMVKDMKNVTPHAQLPAPEEGNQHNAQNITLNRG
jgi:hypothetical protein